MQGLRCCGGSGGEDGRSRAALRAQSTSLKANMGHLEACAAAAGLASLVVTALGAGLMATNAQLRQSALNKCREVFGDWPVALCSEVCGFC